MKSKKMIQFEADFDNIDKMRIFEIEVTDKRTGEVDYIIFDIFIRGQKFISEHIALSTKQEKSRKIAFVSMRIDSDFSLDADSQELYEHCYNAIFESEFYQLAD